ncbi:hypothetical protein [Dysgonomonas reticulitermitis]
MKKKLLCLSFLAIFSLSFVYGQKRELSFTSHKDGSQITTRPVSMRGKAVNVPVNGHVWVFAHLEGFDGWYPQGIAERTLKNSEWVCAVYLGEPMETGYYEVAVAIVGNEANQALNNWVKTAKENGYPPIPLPDLLDGLIETIRVEKR